MTLRVDIKTELFRWARERAGIHVDGLAKRFPKYPEWESGEKLVLKRTLMIVLLSVLPGSSAFGSGALHRQADGT